MLYKTKLLFPKALRLCLYTLRSDFSVFWKTSRFNFWFYSIAIEENYCFLSTNSLLSIRYTVAPFGFTSFQHVLLSALKSSVFKWRFHFQVIGLGFKIVDISARSITFSLGFSHSVIYYLRENMFALRTNRQKQSFKVFGSDLSAATLLSGTIKRLKSPDIYKGKGLRFSREKLKLRKREKYSR